MLLLGSGFALLGIWLIIYGHHRHMGIDRALDRGEYVPLSGRQTSILLVVGIVLGVSTFVLILYVALR